MSIVLTADKAPPATDIFRIYRQNHPDSFVSQEHNRSSGPGQSFKTDGKIKLTSQDNWDNCNSIVPILKDQATVSAAMKQISLVTDINKMLNMNNFEGAEYLMGRKLTDEEKQNKLLSDKFGPREYQAMRDVQMEELKEKVRQDKKKYLMMLEQYKKNTNLVTRAALARHRAVTMAEMEELLEAAIASREARKKAQQDEVNEFAHFGDDEDRKDEDRKDEDRKDENRQDENRKDDEFDPNKLPPLPPSDDDDDEVQSIASTRFAPTVIDDGESKQQESHYYMPWTNKPTKLTKLIYHKRLEDLKEKYPELETTFTGYKRANKPELEVMEKNAEDWLNDKLAEEAALDSLKTHSAGEVLEQTGNGSLFTGLRRMKNEKDYVKFGPKFLIDLKRLKTKSEFSLAYPKSGQKPNLIRNAILTPALKRKLFLLI